MSGRPQSGFLYHNIGQLSLLTWYQVRTDSCCNNKDSHFSKLFIQLFITTWCNGAINSIYLEHSSSVLKHIFACHVYIRKCKSIINSKPQTPYVTKRPFCLRSWPAPLKTPFKDIRNKNIVIVKYYQCSQLLFDDFVYLCCLERAVLQ